MNRLKLRSSFALVLLLALILPILAACGGTPPVATNPTAAGGTTATAAPVAPTAGAGEVPTAEVAPTAAAEAPTEETPPTGGATGDTIIVGTWQEPGSFVDYANSQAIQVEISLIFRPRLVTRRDFKFQPNPTLVDGDLPTFENGGVKQVDVTVKAGDPYFDVESKSV